MVDTASLDTFDKPIDVYRYLKEEGWQIGRSQFYEHIKQKLLRPKKGVFTLEAIEKYANLNLRNNETGQRVNEKQDRLQEEKLENEVKAAKLKVEREEHELNVKKGRYITREEHELAIVGRAVAFMAHLNHSVQKSVPDWIDLVDGNQEKAADLVAAITEEIEIRMSDFAADTEFEVHLEAD